MTIGTYRHAATFQTQGPAVPDGDGGFMPSWVPLGPSPWWVSVAPLSAHDLERTAPGTVISTATHIVRGRYLPGVSVSTRMLWNGRTFAIAGTRNLDERSIAMELYAVELVGPQ